LDSAGRPRKRDKAAKATKKIAKGAGIALGVALFPITIPLYVAFVYSPRKWRGPEAVRFSDGRIDGRVHAFPTASLHSARNPCLHYGRLEPAVPYPQGWENYDSGAIPAELPALHELDREGPDMALVRRLFNADLKPVNG
jgi:hypothetical protein